MRLSNNYETVKETTPPNVNVVKENPAQYAKVDRLFKQLIKTFFVEFIEAFFPEHYEKIDFTSLNFLSGDIIQDIAKDLFVEDRKFLDILAEVKYDGSDIIIFIRKVPQNYLQKDFPKRMLHDYSLLYKELRKPIIPIAILHCGEARDMGEYNMKVFGKEVMRFKYHSLHLQKMNWQDFIHKENPASASLLSKMNYDKSERVSVTLAFYRLLAKLKNNSTQRKLLINFFRSYLQLSEEEEEYFMKEVKNLEEAEKILKIIHHI